MAFAPAVFAWLTEVRFGALFYIIRSRDRNRDRRCGNRLLLLFSSTSLRSYFLAVSP